MKDNPEDNTKELSETITKLKNEVSERRRVEESLKAALEESQKREHEISDLEERFHKLVETANDAIVSIDSCGNVISWNNGAEATFGYSAEEMSGKELTLIIPERFREAHTKGMSKLLSTGVAKLIGKTIEFIGLRRDGVEFPIELSLTSWKTKAGTFFTGIIRDITERKKAEAEISKLNLELRRHSDELEAANRELESFSYSVSHDLRAPLRAIDGFSKALFEDYKDNIDDEGKRLLQVVRDNTRRMGLLIEDILAFSRVGRKDIEIFNINMEGLAREVCNELISSAGKRTVRIEIKAMPPALGDRSMIRQVFANLISNALKFTAKRADAVIEAGSMAADSGPGTVSSGRDKDIDKQNIYYLKDNGVGFDMHYSDRLFGVFQRLHSSEEFEGTGIGLAIVKRIISKHGGSVWAEGRPGEGATFYFKLPVGK